MRSNLIPPQAFAWLKQNKVTNSVLVICTIIYLTGHIGLEPMMFSLMHFPGVLEPIPWWQSYRYITPALMHFSAMHFVPNLLLWFIFGKEIETRQSPLAIFCLFITIGFISNWAQFLDSGPYFEGLSGVVYGLVGYLWLTNYLSPAPAFNFPPAIMSVMVAWLVLGFSGLLDFIAGPVGNMSHLSGLIAGLLMALIAFIVKKSKKKRT